VPKSERNIKKPEPTQIVRDISIQTLKSKTKLDAVLKKIHSKVLTSQNQTNSSKNDFSSSDRCCSYGIFTLNSSQYQKATQYSQQKRWNTSVGHDFNQKRCFLPFWLPKQEIIQKV
jgi:hypothetical protein